jgi:hypothetical protein
MQEIKKKKKKMKRKATFWETVFENQISDEQPIFSVYKESQNSTVRQ